MIEKSCYCGKSKKRFMVDIGEKYLGECCEKAGFNHKGNPPKQKKIKTEGPTRPYKPSGKFSKKNKKAEAAQITEDALNKLIHPDESDEQS